MCRNIKTLFNFAPPATEQEIRAAFAAGWEVESIEPARFEIRPDLEKMSFSAGGPYAWFSVIRRL